MAPVFGELIVGATIPELTQAGVLVPYRPFSHSEPDMAGARTVGGDFAEDDLAERCDIPTLVGDIIVTWFKRGEGRPTLVFAVNRKHAQHILQLFLEAEIVAEYIDAFTDRREREAIFDRFRRGETRVICSIATLEVGIDLPMVSCIVDARPTRSRMAFIQRFGRGLRIHPGKADLLYLDHAGNCLRLGLPGEISQDFLDDGSAKNRKKREIARDPPLPRLCGECRAVVAPRARFCPECGAQILAKTEVQHIDGELIEVGSKKSGKTEPTVEEKAIIFGELKGYVEEQRRRGKNYKDGYAAALYKERFGAWPNLPSIRYAPAIPPSIATRNWITYRNIHFAKSRDRRAPSHEDRVDG
jgi:DNA repair protein RadD